MTLPRHSRPARHAVLAAALLAVLAGGCTPGDEPDPAAPATEAPAADAGAATASGPGAAGQDADADRALPERPGLRVATLDHGDYDLAGHRGKWVVVNFWATWCAPCLKEMPELSALDAMNEQVEVIGLAYEDIDAAAMREFLASHPVVYPIAIVDVYAPPEDFETPRGLPMTYLVAPDGTVAERFLGPVTAADIEAVIAASASASAPAA